MKQTESEIVMKLHNKLCSSKLYYFPKKGKISVSTKHGVYIIYSATDEILHVGMAPYGKGGLNQRLYNHITKTGVLYREYLKPKNIS